LFSNYSFFYLRVKWIPIRIPIPKEIVIRAISWKIPYRIPTPILRLIPIDGKKYAPN